MYWGNWAALQPQVRGTWARTIAGWHQGVKGWAGAPARREKCCGDTAAQRQSCGPRWLVTLKPLVAPEAGADGSADACTIWYAAEACLAPLCMAPTAAGTMAEGLPAQPPSGDLHKFDSGRSLVLPGLLEKPPPPIHGCQGNGSLTAAAHFLPTSTPCTHRNLHSPPREACPCAAPEHAMRCPGPYLS